MQKPEGGGYGETNEIDQEDPSRHWPRLRDEITCGGPGSAVLRGQDTHLMTVSLAPEAIAASSSSVMSMARFITVGSLVFRVGALP